MERHIRGNILLCVTCSHYVCYDVHQNPQPSRRVNARNILSPDSVIEGSEIESSAYDSFSDSPSNASSDVSNGESGDSLDDLDILGLRRGLGSKNAIWAYGWRAFLTYFLLQSANGADFEERLSYVPQTFSVTWGRVFRARLLARNHVSQQQCDNALHGTPRQVRDISTSLEVFHARLATGKLAELRDALNDTAVPSVRCPFGCSEYIEKTGAVAYHHFLRT